MRIIPRSALTLLLVAGCAGSTTQPSLPSSPPAPRVTASTPVQAEGIVPLRTARPGFVLPNRSLTPGAVQSTNKADICPHTNPAFEDARPGTSVKARIYLAYGILSHVTGQYEIDHLVPLELGGANDPRNLWPEPNDHPHGALNSKDLLENKLHSLVCSGQLSMTAAQKAIEANWVTAYAKYIG